MSEPASLPLFALNTVLFPDGLLPLRIFEPRYVSMVSRCVQESSGFGVVAIDSGREVGAAARCHSVGTYARIIDFDRTDDGMLTIVARGERRFRVLDTEIALDQLLTGRVTWLDEPPAMALPDRTRPLLRLLEQLIEQAGPPFTDLERREETGWVVARLVELLPFAPADKQRVLACDDNAGRLRILYDDLLADVIGS
jgi:Lon protease-like protein